MTLLRRRGKKLLYAKGRENLEMLKWSKFTEGDFWTQFDSSHELGMIFRIENHHDGITMSFHPTKAFCKAVFHNTCMCFHLHRGRLKRSDISAIRDDVNEK